MNFFGSKIYFLCIKSYKFFNMGEYFKVVSNPKSCNSKIRVVQLHSYNVNFSLMLFSHICQLLIQCMCLMHKRQEKGGGQRLSLVGRQISRLWCLCVIFLILLYIYFPLLFLLFLMSLRRIAQCHTTLLYTSLRYKTLPFPTFVIFWIISNFWTQQQQQKLQNNKLYNNILIFCRQSFT